MPVRIEKVELPGIGVRHDIVTASGRRLGVVVHRSGEHDLAVFDRDDPDDCQVSVPLTDEEAAALAEVLGAAVMLQQIADLSREVDGLVTTRLTVAAGSPYAGRTLGETRARTRTGASVVALLRHGEVVPSPGPDQVLLAGDVVVVVGTRTGIEAVTRIFADDET